MKATQPTRTVAPLASLISTADAKTHCRVDTSDEDTYIDALVAAAEGYLDGYTGTLGRALVTQEWSQSFDGFPDGRIIRLPLGPIQSIDTFTYYNTANGSTAFTSYSMAEDEIGPMAVLDDGASWPTTYERPDAVTIAWTAGYGDAASDVPASIIHAAKLLVGHWYATREAVSGFENFAVPFAVQALIQPHRKVGT